MSAHRFIKPIRLFQTILIVVLCGIIALSVSASNGDKRSSDKESERNRVVRHNPDSNDKRNNDSDSSDKNARSQDDRQKENSNNRDSAKRDNNANNDNKDRGQNESKYQSSDRNEQRPVDNSRNKESNNRNNNNDRQDTQIHRNIPTVEYNDSWDKRYNSDRTVSQPENNRRENNKTVDRNIPTLQIDQKVPDSKHNNSWDKRDENTNQSSNDKRDDNNNKNRQQADKNRDDSKNNNSWNKRDGDWKNDSSNDKRDRDGNRDNNNAKRSFRPPIYKNGFYHYDDRPNYRPSHFGYWMFNDYDSRECRRSAYYHYGYFPYLNVTRIIVAPYTRTSYYRGFSIDDYYLSRYRDYRLDDTLRDIRDAWLSNRSDLIEDHVYMSQNIAVLLDGEYDYSINGDDYYNMTSDAIDEIRTINFTWQGVRQRSDGNFTAFARHQYYDAYGTPKTVYVSYTFDRIRDYYYIVEVGSSVYSLF